MTRRAVNRSLLRETTHDIELFAKDVGTFIADVEADVAEKCAQYWSSDASEKYQETHAEWQGLMTKIQKDFSDLATIAANTLHNYGHATSVNLEMLER